jgi:hypothetical protein
VKRDSCRAILTPPKAGPACLAKKFLPNWKRKGETPLNILSADSSFEHYHQRSFVLPWTVFEILFNGEAKRMPLAKDMKQMVDQIVSSYETRIESIGTLFDTTHQVLQGFQDSLLDTREERGKLNEELRENLAKNKSLRRKDFDNLMEGIILTQNEREKEVRDLLNTYLNEQRAMARDLKDNLGKFRDSLSEGEAQRVKEFQQMIKEILAKQTERKDEVISKLKEFKKEQKMLASRLNELLAKGRALRIKDLKRMLNESRGQYEERLARQEERKREVRHLLCERKKGRN